MDAVQIYGSPLPSKKRACRSVNVVQPAVLPGSSFVPAREVAGAIFPERLAGFFASAVVCVQSNSQTKPVVFKQEAVS